MKHAVFSGFTYAKKQIWKAIENFFFAKAILNRYYMWKNTSKNSGIFFLGTIFL